MAETLKQRIARHEGFRAKAYVDTEGFLTIGYGHKLAPGQAEKLSAGLTRDEADQLLDADIFVARNNLRKSLPWTEQLDPFRRDILVEMAFQLGVNGLLGFRNFLFNLRAGDYEAAAREMQRSLWRKQTPRRCEELARLMIAGK